jgi:peptidyl-prolyl cis-trans isomerase D
MREAVARQAVETLIAEQAQRIEANRLGLATPDAQVVAYVHAIPNFQSAGTYDRLALEQFLRQNEMTEGMFLQLVRDDLQRMQLVGAVRAGAPAPDTLARALFGWEREQRIARVVELPLLEAPEPESPTQAQLERFHANNPDRFSTPELREVTLAVLSAETLRDQVEVTEAELRTAFEARRAQFETPERRQVEQVLVQTEEAARQLAAAWAGSADFAAISHAAQAAGGTASALGTVSRADLPLPHLFEARRRARGDIGDAEDVPAEGRLHRLGHVARRHREDRLAELRQRQVGAADGAER